MRRLCSLSDQGCREGRAPARQADPVCGLHQHPARLIRTADLLRRCGRRLSAHVSCRIAGQRRVHHRQGPEFFWVGAKYELAWGLSFTGAYYHVNQNSLRRRRRRLSDRGGAEQSLKVDCAGAYDQVSFLTDYALNKHLDVYAGATWAQVTNGLASGFPGTAGRQVRRHKLRRNRHQRQHGDVHDGLPHQALTDRRFASELPRTCSVPRRFYFCPYAIGLAFMEYVTGTAVPAVADEDEILNH